MVGLLVPWFCVMAFVASLEGCMFRIGLTVVSVISAIGMNASANPVYHENVDYRSTSGLSCRPISLASVYAGSSKTSRYLGSTRNFIAVTGPTVNDFFPIITGRGIRGWVDSQEVQGAHGGGHVDHCWVQQARDGRLLFGWSQPGQG